MPETGEKAQGKSPLDCVRVVKFVRKRRV